MFGPFFPYGSQYYRTPNPPENDWEQDLHQIKAQGMNTVRLWAMWSQIHRENDEFDFSHLNCLMALCKETGLKALIQVILENAPAWLVQEHPEARYVANDGQAIEPMGRPNTPGGGWPGLCLDNAIAGESAEKFMMALARHFAGHEALLGYDVWNEIWFELDGYIGNQYYCYCPETICEFKVYLRKKYRDLDGLSRAWYRQYSSWDEVLPPKYWGGYPDWIDWIQFRVANQGRLLRWRVETLRRADAGALLVSHGLPNTLSGMATQLTDDWRNSREVQIYGLSCFPLWFKYDPTETFKVHDMVRGASGGKTFWTAEMQAGPAGEGLTHSKTPTPNDLKLWNWVSLATGAKGILYWQWRPELLGPESPGFGLCQLDGSPGERTRTASFFARLIHQHAELRESSPIRGDVAIAVVPESQIFCHVADRSAGKYAQSIKGIYRALSQAGYQVDFVRMDEITDYPLLYLPFPLMLEETTASALVEYVRNGGTLISEACPAQFGDGGFTQVISPGYGLHDVFGVQAAEGPESLDDEVPAIRWNEQDVDCIVHRQRLTATGATILAEYCDGGPAITCHTFGRGRAVLIGTYPGIAAEWGSGESARLLVELAGYVGILPRIEVSSPDVQVRLHRHSSGVIAYVVNTTTETKNITFKLRSVYGTILQGVDVLFGSPIPYSEDGFVLTLGPCDAKVLRLPKVVHLDSHHEENSLFSERNTL
ncbi:MAG: cellulase family glycosylhydrolase [Phycisphaerae bacterium]|nr:cellulase family glycosylhydrolase [Phycisphaerae bacterium]